MTDTYKFATEVVEKTVKDNDKEIVKTYTRSVTEKFSIAELERRISELGSDKARIDEEITQLQAKIDEAKTALSIK